MSPDRPSWILLQYPVGVVSDFMASSHLNPLGEHFLAGKYSILKVLWEGKTWWGAINGNPQGGGERKRELCSQIWDADVDTAESQVYPQRKWSLFFAASIAQLSFAVDLLPGLKEIAIPFTPVPFIPPPCSPNKSHHPRGFSGREEVCSSLNVWGFICMWPDLKSEFSWNTHLTLQNSLSLLLFWCIIFKIKTQT